MLNGALEGKRESRKGSMRMVEALEGEGGVVGIFPLGLQRATIRRSVSALRCWLDVFFVWFRWFCGPKHLSVRGTNQGEEARRDSLRGGIRMHFNSISYRSQTQPPPPPHPSRYLPSPLGSYKRTSSSRRGFCGLTALEETRSPQTCEQTTQCRAVKGG